MYVQNWVVGRRRTKCGRQVKRVYGSHCSRENEVQAVVWWGIQRGGGKTARGNGFGWCRVVCGEQVCRAAAVLSSSK